MRFICLVLDIVYCDVLKPGSAADPSGITQGVLVFHG